MEFLQKKIAKQVAASLNNTLIGGKKSSRWHDEIWNIKYLHRYTLQLSFVIDLFLYYNFFIVFVLFETFSCLVNTLIVYLEKISELYKK